MKKMNKKGFTIVELVIVIAVIAILSAVMIPTFSGIVTKANQSAVQQKAAAAFKEIYAADLSDGKCDAKDSSSGTDVTLGASNNYTVDATGKVTNFTYTDGSITATFDGTDWTVSGT